LGARSLRLLLGKSDPSFPSCWRRDAELPPGSAIDLPRISKPYQQDRSQGQLLHLVLHADKTPELARMEM
jgi:hypothetical protein